MKVAKWKQTFSATYHIIKMVVYVQTVVQIIILFQTYKGWNFNSGNYLFTTDTK